VYESGRVEELKPGGDIHNAGEVAWRLERLEGVESIPAGTDGVPAPIAEERSESFATAEQSGRIVDERGELRRDRGHPWSPLCQELVDAQADEID